MTTETIDKPDETSLRRATFLGGEPITLADGLAWHFPRPCVVFRPRFSGGSVSSRFGTDLGPDFDRAVREISDLASPREDDETAPGRAFVDALMNLAVLMLRINYDLSDDQLGALLEYRVDDEGSQDTWGAILDVARGNAPKPTSGTTGSPS